ncbi:MAG: DUF2268 domain-containing putative Zn-dependent protease [Allorhizobium sp.]
MQLQLHFLEAEGSLAPWRSVLQQQADSIVARIGEIVPSRFHRHAVDVVIQYLPDEAIPELGIGGSCFRRGLVTINLDPEAADFEKHLNLGFFSRTLAHELHHAMRWAACGYGFSLGEALVSEGLADVFSEIVTGLSAPPWSNALIVADWSAIIDQAENELDAHDYDHAAWFFGSGELPRWAGYTIGYHLARLYSRNNQDVARTGMIDVPSSAVLAAWPKLKAEILAAK